MAKKQVQLQIEVDNDEAWEKLVDRPGLIVVDIFSEWCGPCAGMMGTLRKVKLEFGGEYLTLGAAKCDEITCLSRFRGNSTPTWMFISKKKTIKLMFGANSPELMAAMLEEINNEKKSIPRAGIEFDELTEEEQVVADEKLRQEEEKKQREEEEKEAALLARREEVIENLLEPLALYNYVMISRHLKADAINQIMDEFKGAGLSLGSKHPVKYQLTEDDIYEMFYYSSWEFSDDELDHLLADYVTGIDFVAISDEIDIVELFKTKVYGESMCPPGSEDSLAMKFSTTIKIPKEVPEEDFGSQEDNFVELHVPGCYVAENEKCKILGMRILFPKITSKFDLPELVPIPPHLIIAFDVLKRNDVYQLMEQFPEETMSYGFFSGVDELSSAKLIAKTIDQFERTFSRPLDTKLVLKVSKKNSEPLLSYSMLGAYYVSPNTTIGEKECAIIFTEEYEDMVFEIEEDIMSGPRDYDDDDIDNEEYEIEDEEDIEEEGEETELQEDY